MKVTCPTCGNPPSQRVDARDYLPERCPDAIHDLADQLAADLFAQADELGIPRDPATVREAVRLAQGARSKS